MQPREGREGRRVVQDEDILRKSSKTSAYSLRKLFNSKDHKEYFRDYQYHPQKEKERDSCSQKKKVSERTYTYNAANTLGNTYSNVLNTLGNTHSNLNNTHSNFNQTQLHPTRHAHINLQTTTTMTPHTNLNTLTNLKTSNTFNKTHKTLSGKLSSTIRPSKFGETMGNPHRCSKSPNSRQNRLKIMDFLKMELKKWNDSLSPARSYRP